MFTEEDIEKITEIASKVSAKDFPLLSKPYSTYDIRNILLATVICDEAKKMKEQ